MTKRRHHNKGKRTALIIITALALVGGVQFLFGTQIPLLSSLSFSLARPLWVVQERVEGRMRDMSVVFARKSALLKDNERLSRELAEAEVRVRRVSALVTENTLLRSFLGQTGEEHEQDVEDDHLLTTVIKKPSETPYDTLILDVGGKHGVEEGALVLLSDGAPIGRISEVGGRVAKAHLFSSPGVTSDVFVGDESISAEAVGRGAGVLAITLPRDSSVSVGSVVYYPSSTLLFLGTVEHIIEKPTDPTKTLLFTLPKNIFSLRFLFVDMRPVEEVFAESASVRTSTTTENMRATTEGTPE